MYVKNHEFWAGPEGLPGGVPYLSIPNSGCPYLKSHRVWELITREMEDRREEEGSRKEVVRRREERRRYHTLGSPGTG